MILESTTPSNAFSLPSFSRKIVALRRSPVHSCLRLTNISFTHHAHVFVILGNIIIIIIIIIVTIYIYSAISHNMKICKGILKNNALVIQKSLTM